MTYVYSLDSQAMWAAVCRVLINEIITVRSLYLDPSVLAVPVLGEAELLAALDELQVAMAHFAPSSALMSTCAPFVGPSWLKPYRLPTWAYTAGADRCLIDAALCLDRLLRTFYPTFNGRSDLL